MESLEDTKSVYEYIKVTHHRQIKEEPFALICGVSHLIEGENGKINLRTLQGSLSPVSTEGRIIFVTTQRSTFEKRKTLIL